MTDAQIKHMVEQFLKWRLPDPWHPDGGITFNAEFNEHTAHPGKHRPVGTNLFDYTQAEAMVRNMVEGLPPAPSGADAADLEAAKRLLRNAVGSLSEDGHEPDEPIRDCPGCLTVRDARALLARLGDQP